MKVSPFMQFANLAIQAIGEVNNLLEALRSRWAPMVERHEQEIAVLKERVGRQGRQIRSLANDVERLKGTLQDSEAERALEVATTPRRPRPGRRALNPRYEQGEAAHDEKA